ncbi:ABC-2 type transport system ATP-binding protein [Enterococcus sp. PF1-24]|uniref:ABC transporter ATP-binding protein n=1 Tax=unclassified Enterococcus TaxID=2608891 RepID=UPI002476EE1E|nr:MULTISPECIES: ABC transporter ATP-binding protein [unclassified Enterococcus]MDH6365699.1 ABC-2 type transport system ATP-binding protein [Enterococcus sp. PFB1-1]MDH6402801.1 ABC-2 type transport system ATP-binding protein [Enterococcus sp. PF1-24]
MKALEVIQIDKAFGSKQILNKVSFSVEKGSIFGFVGENGAGKTTTMKLILGLLQLDSGEIKVNGQTVKYGNSLTNRKIGYLSDVPEFYGYMTATQYLRLCGELTAIKKALLPEKIQHVLTLVGLTNQSKKISGYSRGMKQRLGLAQALLNEPEILICDEPTSALDPLGRKAILDILNSLRGKTTVLFSSHILSDIEQVCDHVAILHKGKIQLQGEVNQLKAAHSSFKYAIRFTDTASLIKFTNAMKTETLITEEVENQLIFSGKSLNEMSQLLLTKLLQENISPKEIFQIEPSLEELFMGVVK